MNAPLAFNALLPFVVHRMLAQLPRDSLGAYIISMAKTSSDVLAVLLLMRECGMREPLRVVPLFETLDDLTAAPATMRTLFEDEWYLNLIEGTQECMIGEGVGGQEGWAGGVGRRGGLG
jgi:phosphoenolpyruvate carboxylase